ncbi:hypothetical protein ASG57_05895 [Bradyrhizobium sp. Leaf396]|jgi:hypothetical protein|nr:hypothetical protein ASG57_05895 [Bradyrhizobium sp. Leaf396]
MWHWVRDTVRVRRARKAAADMLVPIVEQSRARLGGISEAVWSDPYITGLVVMLISVVARVEGGEFSERALFRIQHGAWHDITSVRDSGIAERFMLLNKGRDRDFELGCHNAAAFALVLFSTKEMLEGAGVPLVDTLLDSPVAQREDVREAWSQCFDAYICARANDPVGCRDQL